MPSRTGAATPSQIRAGRALLGWSREELADRSGIGPRTLARLESGEGQAKPETLGAVTAALAAAGVRLDADGKGVRRD